MKLDELVGAELYAQIKEKLDEVNSKEPDKLKHVRFADLSEGEYVSKLKYEDLVTQLNGKDTELKTANDLIEQLKLEGTTMLGIFHDLEFMEGLCDREYNMQKGMMA